MSTIRISENNVLAVETRTGLFVIAQALKHRTLVFFNLFTQSPLSLNAELENEKVLCCVTPTRDFFQGSNIIRLKIKPASNVAKYREQNRLADELLTPWESFIVYKGTKDEFEIPYVKTGELRLVDWQCQTLKHLNKQQDKEIIESHQLATMGIYGELNERLYLCYRYGRYVEPLKDLRMGKELPLAYKSYYQFTANLLDRNEWLNLPIEDVIY